MGNICCNEETSGKPVERLPVYDVVGEDPAEMRAKAAAAEADKKRKEDEMKAANEEAAKQEEIAKQKEAAEKEAAKKEAAEATTKKQEVETAAVAESPKTCEFTIDLKKMDASKWGFSLIVNDDFMAIKDSTGPAFEEWLKNNPTKKILFGDQIVSLNGVSGDTSTLTEVLRSSSEVNILFRRQLEIFVTAKKPLGLRFAGEDSLDVTEVLNGGIKAYNDLHEPYVNIGPGDLLESVNGQTTNLLEHIKKTTEEVKLVFSRPQFE